MGFLFGGGKAPTVGESPYTSGAGQLEMQNAQQAAQSNYDQGLTSLEDAQRDAMLEAIQGHHYREDQAVQVTNNGILNQGSPLLNLEYTRMQVQAQADATMQAGQAQAKKFYQTGFQTLNEGRAALLGQQDQFITNQAQANIQQTLQRGQAWDGILSGGISSVLQPIGQAAGQKVASWLFP